MKIKALVTVALCLAPLVTNGEGEPAMIWVAEGEHNRVYLLGSIHLLRERDHPLPQVIDDVYDDSERVVMELDMDDLDPVAMFATLSSLGVLKDGRTLRDIMGEAMYARAERAAAEVEIPIDMLQQSEPWLAAMTVQEILMMRIGFKADKGIEMHLTAKAVSDGKPIDGLETVDEQLGFLDGLSIETQNRWLLYSILEARRLEMMIDDIVAAWRRGDADFVERELLYDMQSYPELHDSLLVRRNHRWVDQIREMLDDQDDYLVVVGAAHLVGDDGVPDLLSNRGVRIRQLHEPVR
ncbi:MAG: TraB/GumN family protein [Woeseiaceae bacterium]